MTGGTTGRDHPRDPWRRTRVGELGEPLLPRWFAILAVILVPLGIAVTVIAFLSAGRAALPVAERRPPMAGELTSDVGVLQAGDAAAVDLQAPCPVVEGVRVAGADAAQPEVRDDLETLRAGLAELCERALPGDVVRPLRDFGRQGGVVRFAVFERTAIDVTGRVGSTARPPVIYLNAKYSRTPASWLAPLVVFEAARLTHPEPGTAKSVLAGRKAELTACTTLGLHERTSGCNDAAELLNLPDPLGALIAAGHR